MKNNRGEISILMIITIISLIIFGGICIFMLTGENGLFIEKEQTNIQQNTNNEVENKEENVVDEKNKEDEALTVPMQ